MDHVVSIWVVDKLIGVIQNTANYSLDLVIIAVVNASLEHAATMLVGSNFFTLAHDFLVHEIDLFRHEVAEALLDHMVSIGVEHQGDNMTSEFLQDFLDQLVVLNVFDDLLDDSSPMGGVGHLDNVWNQNIDNLGQLVIGAELNNFLAQVVSELVIGVFLEVLDDLVKYGNKELRGVLFILNSSLELLASLLVLNLVIELFQNLLNGHVHELIETIVINSSFVVHVHHVLETHHVHHWHIHHREHVREAIVHVVVVIGVITVAVVGGKPIYIAGVSSSSSIALFCFLRSLGILVSLSLTIALLSLSTVDLVGEAVKPIILKEQSRVFLLWFSVGGIHVFTEAKFIFNRIRFKFGRIFRMINFGYFGGFFTNLSEERFRLHLLMINDYI